MAGNRQPLYAQIIRAGRGSTRCTVRLAAPISGANVDGRSLIQDLSETGLRIQNLSAVDLGESLIVELPFIGQAEARIVWTDPNNSKVHGAEFLSPIPKAAVSAALLQSHPISPANSIPAELEEIPLGEKLTVGQITAFAQELEQNQSTSGKRLLGFKRSSDGMIIAIVQKDA